ncbi:MAG: ImmA/IrrE family metallo-endopeptidase [Anaerolineae bacterium]|nr:ImmA/IrrE family metallo-endopeptidase [Anaerolineae bacterium]
MEKLFRSFADFLLSSSNVDCLPVNLAKIRRKHNFKKHFAQDINQRGFLLGNNIFIKGEDSRVVQRFTEAHEMMEALYLALKVERPRRFSDDEWTNFLKSKEGLCNSGAAELLMPTHFFLPIVEANGIGLATGSELASLCKTSLTATIRQMVYSDVSSCVFGYLQEGYRKSEQALIDAGKGSNLKPKLRVFRGWRSPHTEEFLCTNESFAENTSFYETLRANISGDIKYSRDKLDLKKFRGVFDTESMLVMINDIRTVLAFIHLN